MRAKFVQNPVLLKALLDTKNKTLIECNPHDLLWANGLKVTRMLKMGPNGKVVTFWETYFVE